MEPYFTGEKKGDIRLTFQGYKGGARTQTQTHLPIPRASDKYTVVSLCAIYSLRLGSLCPQYKNYGGSLTFLTPESGNSSP